MWRSPSYLASLPRVVQPSLLEVMAMDGLPLESKRARTRLLYDWLAKRRPIYYRGWSEKWNKPIFGGQEPPPGDWDVWLLCAGRGYGKTYTVSSWLVDRCYRYPGIRLGAVASTVEEARKILWDGSGSGVKAVAPPWFQPRYHTMNAIATFPNKSQIVFMSAEKPDKIRGENLGGAVADEIAKWSRARETWRNLRLAIRVPVRGDQTRILVATTPRTGNQLLREIYSSPLTCITNGSSFENAANLDRASLREFQDLLKTSWGRQEVLGELLDKMEGSMFSSIKIDETRVTDAVGFDRIVIGIDPSSTDSHRSDRTGIAVCAVKRIPDETGELVDHGYILEDLSVCATPYKWAKIAIDAFYRWRADLIVAETNHGGDWIRSTIEMIDANVPLKTEATQRDKCSRAQPISMLMERGRVHVVGILPELEEEMCSWTPASKTSPDRMDAMVYAMVELMLNGGAAFV